ncbi:MAG: diaminopimelate epimerase [Armatimonadetes bacterium]|nr:diaminopimelate epimerase [Armatimonadota bacterium]
MQIAFTKVEAIGNHFVLVNAVSMPEADWSLIALSMCEHSFGVGADGLLVISASNSADFRFRMWNPDGSEDVCGNGMRCGAVYAYECGLARGPFVTMDAKSGIVCAEIQIGEGGKPSARVNMGVPSIESADIPVAVLSAQSLDVPVRVDGREYTASCIQVGTPHAVIFADIEVFWDEIPADSPLIEKHPLFPDRVNVTWCHVESPGSLVIRTWERGVGPTLGCGSGACAALAAANLHGTAGESASVRSPGGTLLVDWPGRADIFASGPTRTVFEGTWSS